MENNIKTVTVIGGNGTVGSGVAGIFASFGNVKVYVVARTKEKALEGVEKAFLSVKAIAIKKNLIPKTFDELDECIKESDLVFESVSENIDTKKEMHKIINKNARDNCIIATGTSGLSINSLAECYDDKLRDNFFGVHFFNPPYSLTLCELIPSKYNENNEELISKVKDYLEKVLIRDVVIVKDSPAFLANRIGFKFMNEALIYALEYKEDGGIDYIDSILGGYTGRNMSPIETINFVGLDIHKAIVDNIYNNSKDDSFLLPDFVNKLIDRNKLGIKTGEGLYKKEEDKKLVYDIKEDKYREKKIYNFDFKTKAINEFRNANYIEGFNYIKNSDSKESNICMKFLLNYILYSIYLSSKISNNISDCDIAMATGFNWIPPIALIKVLGGTKEVIKLCEKNSIDNIDYVGILKLVEKLDSNYDYSKFIKAKN